MIANPELKAYRYDPYPKVLSIEKYDLPQMMGIRADAIANAKSAQRFGIILGTLGRQGNPLVLDRLTQLLQERGKQYFVLLLSEIFPDKVGGEMQLQGWFQSVPTLMPDVRGVLLCSWLVSTTSTRGSRLRVRDFLSTGATRSPR